MKGSDFIVKFLESLNVKHVFGYQGGMITHLVDSLSKNNNIDFIQCYHEQSAAFAAEGYAKETKNIGVAISTSGPGATNMITGIADAYFDSVPVLYITGQVNSYEYKYNKPIRQQGFQETDIVTIVKPITKYSSFVKSTDELAAKLLKAVSIAFEGRKGPVLLDIPMDVQRLEIFDRLPLYKDPEETNDSIDNLEEVINTLQNAKKPLVLCGNGIIQSNTQAQVENFLTNSKLPYVVTMLGKSSVSENSENFIGMIGSYGNRCANIVLSQADVVLVLGSRLDLRQTGNVKSDNLSKIKFIHVDIDIHELNESKIRNKININSSISLFLNKISEIKLDTNTQWQNFCEQIKIKYSQTNEINRFLQNKEPYFAIKKISSLLSQNITFTADIGQNQVWAAQYLSLKDEDSFITSGGLAPMGFSIPIGIGVAFANPNKKIICITGDGGFQFAEQSLLLISQYKLNVTIYVLNNSSLGMITQFQSLYFNSNMAGTTKEGGYLVPSIKHLALANKLKYKKITNVQRQKMKHNSQTIYEICLPEITQVVPKLEYDKKLFNMIPYLTENELKEITSEI